MLTQTREMTFVDALLGVTAATLGGVLQTSADLNAKAADIYLLREINEGERARQARQFRAVLPTMPP
jgi:hypothetical protein